MEERERESVRRGGQNGYDNDSTLMPWSGEQVAGGLVRGKRGTKPP